MHSMAPFSVRNSRRFVFAGEGGGTTLRQSKKGGYLLNVFAGAQVRNFIYVVNIWFEAAFAGRVSLGRCRDESESRK